MNLLDATRAVFASGLPAHEKLVALALLNHWSRARDTFPGVDRLVIWTSLSRRSVLRAIQNLEDAGAIKVERKTGLANRYDLAPLEALTSATPAPVPAGHPCPDGTPPVPHRHETSAPQAPDQCHTDTRSDPRSDPRSSSRERGQRPIVLAGLLDAKVKARDWNAPQAFADYASELGLEARQYSDVIADFHEKVSRDAAPPWLASQLCRFIEQKAGKLSASVKSATATPRERCEDWA